LQHRQLRGWHSYNLGNFPRQAVLSRAVRHWTLTTLQGKLIKLGAKVVRHSRKIVFQMAELAVPRELFRNILRSIDHPRLATAQRFVVILVLFSVLSVYKAHLLIIGRISDSQSHESYLIL
jgi:hypothetical protein